MTWGPRHSQQKPHRYSRTSSAATVANGTGSRSNSSGQKARCSAATPIARDGVVGRAVTDRTNWSAPTSTSRAPNRSSQLRSTPADRHRKVGTTLHPHQTQPHLDLLRHLHHVPDELTVHVAITTRRAPHQPRKLRAEGIQASRRAGAVPRPRLREHRRRVRLAHLLGGGHAAGSAVEPVRPGHGVGQVDGHEYRPRPGRRKPVHAAPVVSNSTGSSLATSDGATGRAGRPVRTVPACTAAVRTPWQTPFPCGGSHRHRGDDLRAAAATGDETDQPQARVVQPPRLSTGRVPGLLAIPLAVIALPAHLKCVRGRSWSTPSRRTSTRSS